MESPTPRSASARNGTPRGQGAKNPLGEAKALHVGKVSRSKATPQNSSRTGDLALQPSNRNKKKVKKEQVKSATKEAVPTGTQPPGNNAGEETTEYTSQVLGLFAELFGASQSAASAAAAESVSSTEALTSDRWVEAPDGVGMVRESVLRKLNEQALQRAQEDLASVKSQSAAPVVSATPSSEEGGGAGTTKESHMHDADRAAAAVAQAGVGRAVSAELRLAPAAQPTGGLQVLVEWTLQVG